MPFLNIPLKSVQASISSVIGVAAMPWNNPLDYPVVPLAPQPTPVPRDYKWRVILNIDVQNHSSYVTRDPGSYNAQDITVGQWIANVTTGQAWYITTIESKTLTSVTAIVQDVYRYNTFRDTAQVGNGAPGLGIYVIFNLGDSGLPKIDPVPPSGISSSFASNMQSRFEYINLQFDYPLYQENNTFAMNDIIAVDSVLNSFVLADADNRIVLGRITSISDTIPGWFTLNPVQKIVDNLDYLPGDVGDIIYSSTTVPGGITTATGGSQLYIKLRNNTSSVSISTAPGPTTANNVFQLNGHDVTVLAPATINQLVTATNLLTLQTGVSAVTSLIPSVVQTNNLLISGTYGEPALWATSSPASATINGVMVIFNIASPDVGYTDYARPLQMAQSINNAAIPDIVASINGPLTLVITNTAGGLISIINGDLDINAVPFAGMSSGSGVALSTPASTSYEIIFTAVDARAINFMNVVGTTIEDFGLLSVENGTKACGLYIEEGLRTATSTVVTNLTAMGTLNPLIGDQAYVIDSNDGQGNNAGEWSLWLYNGSIWIQTSNHDSATTDAKSLEYTLSPASPSLISIGDISTGRRVTLITVEVTVPFSNTATLSIGYQVDNPVPPPAEPSGLMVANLIDMSVAGTYTTSTDVLFGIDTVQGDVSITASFNNGASVSGSAQIIISYV